ncbi:hypothetical protein DFA_08242 [Cavenderia fasciculata]|uniref:Uncharacterized protein n=1 Tax=Cavenderia fasciculata TaxID=261658 RepID=F4Q5J3_CACFS|nr:uncharacterized protein DFA_08242 [Cavenderia fasciculata]EGG17252.1 hypothetical protein DFA_08242 [Cavenderia fasciculata]|eukprot:XP_004355736.1 hypothetical protein DFA_08242 [Cavenderia fasciculata]
MVRKCYEQSYSMVAKMKVEREVFGVNITGDAGIGKSQWVSYLMYMLGRDDKIVIVLHSIHIDSNTAVLFRYIDGSPTVTESRDIIGILNEAGPEAWYLVDGVSPHPTKTFTVLLSSPSKDSVHKDFRASPTTHDIRYMPDWTFEEIVVANKACFHRDHEIIKDRFEKWGGIPRYVLQLATLQGHQRLLYRALAIESIRAVLGSAL